jgi:hypothetical protein
MKEKWEDKGSRQWQWLAPDVRVVAEIERHGERVPMRIIQGSREEEEKRQTRDVKAALILETLEQKKMGAV